MPTEYWDKSKKRIKDFVDKWLFGKQTNQGELEDDK